MKRGSEVTPLRTSGAPADWSAVMARMKEVVADEDAKLDRRRREQQAELDAQLTKCYRIGTSLMMTSLPLTIMCCGQLSQWIGRWIMLFWGVNLLTIAAGGIWYRRYFQLLFRPIADCSDLPPAGSR